MELNKNGVSKQYRELVNEYSLTFKEQSKSVEWLKREGWVEVLPSPKPTPTTDLKSIVRNGVTVDALGNTVEAWTERDMFSDYTDENGVVVTKAEQETAYLAKLEADKIKAKVKEGEQYIKDTVKGVVDAFNIKYGVNFDSIYNMAIYKDDVDYPLHTQCDTLIKWQNSMWLLQELISLKL